MQMKLLQLPRELRWICLLLILAQAAPPPCNPHDRAALLAFKSAIREDTTGILSSWAGDDCCGGGWEGVGCGPAAGRVTSLQLQRPPDDAQVFMEGTLTAALADLAALQILLIAGMKRIRGPVPAALSNLTRLTQVQLEDGVLSGPFPPLRAPALVSLSLARNAFAGPLPPAFFSGPSDSLVQINLARNRLAGPLPKTFARLPALQYLDLSYNSLSGPIPDAFRQLPSLNYLDLSGNRLSGEIPASISAPPGLAYISLDRNRLAGAIPSRIGSLRNLTTLSLGFNQLTGRIPDSIAGLPNLWNLSLPANRLSGTLPAALAGGVPSLSSIDLSRNNLTFPAFPQWLTRRRLTDVRLAGYGLAGPLPRFAQPDSLTAVDLSGNRFTGGISGFFAPNMSALQTADLSDNLLREDLAAVQLPEQLSSLDLHANRLSGLLPKLLNSHNTRFLEVVDVSNNMITGRIPELSGAVNLKVLSVAGNRITGRIPESISNLSSLEKLDVSRNQISGDIPSGLGRLLRLRWLDLSINVLTGGIPRSLLGIQSLRHVSFRANRLCGPIPQGRPFSIFPKAAYAHNLCLCGPPLAACKG